MPQTIIDRAHQELLEMIREHLVHGDIKAVAIDLGVAQGTVSQVANGRAKSDRIIKALLKKAEANKRTLEKATEYLRKSTGKLTP